MAVFAIYAASSPNRPSLSQQAEAVVVREGFSFWAFLMPFVWCAYHRAWRPLGALVIVSALLGLLFSDAGLNNNALMLGMDVLVALFVGLAAADLRGAALHRRGFDLVNVVVADKEDTALLRHLEQGFVVRKERAEVPVGDIQTAMSNFNADLASPNYRRSAILGLFPEARR